MLLARLFLDCFDFVVMILGFLSFMDLRPLAAFFLLLGVN